MRLLALSGSLRPASSNTALLRALRGLTPMGVEIELFEGLGELPHFDPGLDLDPTDYRAPEPVLALRRAIAAAEGLIICTPEYAFGMPGVLKNALDWCVSMGVIERKAVMALAASPLGVGPFGPGGSRAHQGLIWVLSALGTRIVPEASLVLSEIRTKLNAQGELTDAATAEALRQGLQALVRTIEATPEMHA